MRFVFVVSDSTSGLSSIMSSAFITPKAADGVQVHSPAGGTPGAVTSLPTEHKADPEIEKKVLLVLCDISLDIPSEASVIAEHTSRMLGRKVEVSAVDALLKKFAAQSLIRYELFLVS